MRFTFKYLKPVAVFLIIAFLFQCCKAYDLKLTPIEKAVGPQKKYVKVVTVLGEEILFDSIYYRNNQLYGLVKESKHTERREIELQEDSISQVQIHVLNKPESNRRTLMLIVIPVTIIGGIILVGILVFGSYYE